jgi:UDP-N-acetylmuramoyl-tripeptide--D-alanyl-D-alanine ligase
MRAQLGLGSLNINEIFEITGGKLCKYGLSDDAEVTGVTIDSRNIKPGDMFVALRGERVDGHDYIGKAVDSGAVCILAERRPAEFARPEKSYCLILCDDCVAAVGKLASAYKDRQPHKTVAVTGSVGKTTTKEMIAAVLGVKYKLHKTEGNKNNELGLPLSILSMEKGTEISILEMGMSGFNEIERLSKIARPDYGIITTIGTSHLEQLGSRENILKAKMEIVSGMPADGELVLSADEPLLLLQRGKYNSTFVSVFNESAEFRAVNIRYGDMKTTFDLFVNRRAVTDVEIPALGLHHVYSALFAYAIGERFGMTDDEIKQGIKSFVNADMRQSITDTNGVILVDASYNASPESMRASIEVLRELGRQKGGRTFAYLGDMRELGADTRILHEQLGEFIAKGGLDYLFTFGVAASSIADKAKDCGIPFDRVFENPDVTDPLVNADTLASLLKPNDVLLVKASRAMAAERVLQFVKNMIKTT